MAYAGRERGSKWRLFEAEAASVAPEQTDTDEAGGHRRHLVADAENRPTGDGSAWNLIFFHV